MSVTMMVAIIIGIVIIVGVIAATYHFPAGVTSGAVGTNAQTQASGTSAQAGSLTGLSSSATANQGSDYDLISAESSPSSP